MSKKVYRCNRCKSDNILQEATVMVSPNLPLEPVDLNEKGNWEDFYYCNECEEECLAEETEE